MAVFKNFKDDELIINCECGCDEGIHFLRFMIMEMATMPS